MHTDIVATILLVDDCAEDRHIFISQLNKSCSGLYTFLEADCAEQGLAYAKQTHIDCIVLDFEMPEMTGLEFLVELKKQNAEDLPPVIMVTGRGSEKVAVDALKAGAFDYIMKNDVCANNVYRATHNALEANCLNRSLAARTEERHKAQTELAASEERYRLLVESVRGYALIMLDLNACIVSWNAGARTLFGYHDVEIIGKHVRELYRKSAQSADQIAFELDEARKKEICTVNCLMRRRDRSTFMSVGTISPVNDRHGQICGYSKVIRIADDCTPQTEPAE